MKQEKWDEEQIRSYLDMCTRQPLRAFFPYAAMNWIQHYRSIRKKVNFKYDEMLQPDTNLFNVWAKVHSTWTDEHTAPKDPTRAVWIRKEDRHLLGPELAMFLHLRERFEDIEAWLRARLYHNSTYPDADLIIDEMREEFLLSDTFQTALQFFLDDPIRKFFQDIPDTRTRRV